MYLSFGHGIYRRKSSKGVYYSKKYGLTNKEIEINFKKYYNSSKYKISGIRDLLKDPRLNIWKIYIEETPNEIVNDLLQDPNIEFIPSKSTIEEYILEDNIIGLKKMAQIKLYINKFSIYLGIVYGRVNILKELFLYPGENGTSYYKYLLLSETLYHNNSIKCFDIMYKFSNLNITHDNNYIIILAIIGGHTNIANKLLLDPRIKTSDYINRAIINASEKNHIKLTRKLLGMYPGKLISTLGKENSMIKKNIDLLQDPNFDVK